MRKDVFPVVLAIILVCVGVVFVAAKRTSSNKVGAARPQSPTAVATTGNDDGNQGQVVTTGLFRSIAKRENPVVVAITTRA